MRRTLALLLLIPACVPKDPGDTGPSEASASSGGATSTGGDSVSSAGSSSTGAPEAPTTEAPGATTTDASQETTNATTAAEPDTEGPPAGTTTDGPEVRKVQVLSLHAEPGPHSGLEGVALWESAAPPGCEDAPPASCAELPTLGTPELLVDGEFVGPDGVTLGSRVAVLFPFAQPTCELGCGGYTMTVLIGEGGDGVGGFGQLPVDLPCSTEASDVWLGLDFNVVTLPEQYTAALVLKDRCGASTEERTVLFTPT